MTQLYYKRFAFVNSRSLSLYSRHCELRMKLSRPRHNTSSLLGVTYTKDPVTKDTKYLSGILGPLRAFVDLSSKGPWYTYNECLAAAAPEQ